MIRFFTWIIALVAMVSVINSLQGSPGGYIAISIVGILIVRWVVARFIRKSLLMKKYGDEIVVKKIMGKRIWVGASTLMIKDSWGSPGDIKISSHQKVWCYGRKGKDRWTHRIIFRNDMVSSFTEK